MMESLSFEEENVIKDISNIFKLKKELNYSAIKDIRNPFRLEKDTKAIEYLEIFRIFMNMKNKKKIIVNQQEYVIFGVTIILNAKVMTIEIKHFQFKNILIKLDHKRHHI